MNILSALSALMAWCLSMYTYNSRLTLAIDRGLLCLWHSSSLIDSAPEVHNRKYSLIACHLAIDYDSYM